MGMSDLKISNQVGMTSPVTSLSNSCTLFSEFSVSLQEMGACLLEKTALNDDEDSGTLNVNFFSMPLIIIGMWC